MFLVVSPLARAQQDASGGGGGCKGGCGGCAGNNAAGNNAAGNNAAAANNACGQNAKKQKQATVLFDSVVTNINKTEPVSPTVSGITAQLSPNFTLNKQNQWAWVLVTLPVKGQQAHFMAEAFFGVKNQPTVELAEIAPPSDPNDPTLLNILKEQKVYLLKGLTGV
jgi:hypothetical protein